MRQQRQSALLALATMASTAMAGASARADTVINFDSMPGMVNQSIVVPTASRLSNQFAASGAIFSSLSPFVAVVNLGAGHAISGTNGIGGVNMSQFLAYNVAITVTFVDPANPSADAATTSVSVRGDTSGAGGQVTLQAFNRCGDLLATDTKVDSGGPLLTISLAGPARIHSVRFFSNTANVAFDNFTFADLTPFAQASDIDGNHVVDVNDLLAVITAWGNCTQAICPPDLNCDNVVDVNDLLEVVTQWGPVP